MLDIIQNNPYRFLGIYSNSPTKERVANHNKLKAFLQVGKKFSFPLDLPVLLPAITRSVEAVSIADSKLTLPNEQLRYAQFWFMKATTLDDIAMKNLIAGNVTGAISIWKKKDDASSLQNQIVCALIQGHYSTAFVCAEKLYSQYIKEFVSIILGECNTINAEQLEHSFLDELCVAVGATVFLPYMHNSDWKQYVTNKIIKPLIDTLLSAIDMAKSSQGKGAAARYNAGIKLMNETRGALTQLKALLPSTDLQYQMVADKLGLEILQCGIDYFNGSKASDAARKAMQLQSYAQSIVIGKMAKDRCKENVDILQKIIDNLPPAKVFAEDKAIKEELRRFCQLPDKICHAVTLLNNTKPHLQSIKAKLGANNSFYLKLSTKVIGNALHNIIEEVNAAQQDTEYEPRINPLSYIQQVKSALREAWEATKIMDTFDMESEFKTNRYNQNRSILKDMCEQLGISTSTYPPYTRIPQPRTLSTQNTPPKTSPSATNKTDKTTKHSNKSTRIIINSCVICGVLGILIGGNSGGADAAVGSAIAGIIIGAIIGIGIAEVITD
ncbi:MAG: hypothetical protein LUD00_09085 [Prevotellaceae bacterium]|nr:hypothetical protein [Prevotellaceae bacterium]